MSCKECSKEATHPFISPLYCKEHYFLTEEWKDRLNKMSIQGGELSIIRLKAKRTAFS